MAERKPRQPRTASKPAGRRQKKTADPVANPEARLAELSEEMFKLRFQWAMGQTESLKKMRELRKDRARLLTILGEKESEK